MNRGWSSGVQPRKVTAIAARPASPIAAIKSLAAFGIRSGFAGSTSKFPQGFALALSAIGSTANPARTTYKPRSYYLQAPLGNHGQTSWAFIGRRRVELYKDERVAGRKQE
jgi:hypothetical protein